MDNLLPTHLQPYIKASRSYRIIKLLGSGSYGTVYSALSNNNGKTTYVAVKITRPLTSTLKSVRTLREIRILRQLDHENIVKFRRVTKTQGKQAFTKIYIIQELMQSNLEQFMTGCILLPEHIQFIFYQLLRGLKYIHSANVVHRDIKPANLLMNDNCELKICDFGLSRVLPLPDQSQQLMTEYVVTRWYRAPEVIFKRRYNTAIDIWSAGCVLAEMLLSDVLFKAKTDAHLIHLITAELGFHTVIELYPEAIFECPTIERHGRLKSTLLDPQARDLLLQMLHANPTQRISAYTALQHSYVRSYYTPGDEPIAPAKLLPEDFIVDYSRSLPSTIDIRGKKAMSMSIPN